MVDKISDFSLLKKCYCPFFKEIIQNLYSSCSVTMPYNTWFFKAAVIKFCLPCSDCDKNKLRRMCGLCVKWLQLNTFPPLGTWDSRRLARIPHPSTCHEYRAVPRRTLARRLQQLGVTQLTRLTQNGRRSFTSAMAQTGAITLRCRLQVKNHRGLSVNVSRHQLASRHQHQASRRNRTSRSSTPVRRVNCCTTPDDWNWQRFARCTASVRASQDFRTACKWISRASAPSNATGLVRQFSQMFCTFCPNSSASPTNVLVSRWRNQQVTDISGVRL